MNKIKEGDTVVVNYTGKFENGEIFDSSLTEGREPIKVKLGQNQVIPGFEKAILDMGVGEKRTFEIEPEEGYGVHKSEMIFDVPKSQFPEGVEAGALLSAESSMGPVRVKVLEINEETIKIDANHPLAGRKLIFELEVMEVES